jgi:hypothetical protein
MDYRTATRKRAGRSPIEQPLGRATRAIEPRASASGIEDATRMAAETFSSLIRGRAAHTSTAHQRTRLCLTCGPSDVRLFHCSQAMSIV